MASNFSISEHFIPRMEYQSWNKRQTIDEEKKIIGKISGKKMKKCQEVVQNADTCSIKTEPSQEMS